MAEYQMVLVDRREIAQGTMAFWFDPNGATYQFRAGQHADFSFTPSFAGAGADTARTFSLASSPHEPGPLMIAMRMRDSQFKSALKTAPLGTSFRVSRPRGSFTLHKDSARPAVLLAGGIGITPMRSILCAALQERLPHKLYLFYSNRQPQDAAFLDELKGLAAGSDGYTFIPVLTRTVSPGRTFEHGPIDRELLARHLPGLNAPVYYVSGPSGMVATMTALLQNMGASDDDIKTEEFGDYKPEPPRQP